MSRALATSGRSISISRSRGRGVSRPTMKRAATASPASALSMTMRAAAIILALVQRLAQHARAVARAWLLAGGIAGLAGLEAAPSVALQGLVHIVHHFTAPSFEVSITYR